MQCSKDVNTGLWMMPLTSCIEAPTYETRRNGEGQNADERKISTTSESGWANFTRQHEKGIKIIKGKQHDSQWMKLDGTLVGYTVGIWTGCAKFWLTTSHAP